MSTKETTDIDEKVGRRLRARREALRMSQGEMGAMAGGISFQQVQKYEKGYNRISASRLKMFADALRVSVAYFFDDGPGMVEEGPVQALLSTPEGVELVTAFAGITDANERRRVLDIVKAAADGAEDFGVSGDVE